MPKPIVSSLPRGIDRSVDDAIERGSWKEASARLQLLKQRDALYDSLKSEFATKVDSIAFKHNWFADVDTFLFDMANQLAMATQPDEPEEQDEGADPDYHTAEQNGVGRY